MHSGRHLRAAPSCLSLEGGEGREENVSRPLNIGRGTKRRIRQVRWTHREIISVAFFLLAMVAFSVFIGLWVISHHFD
jgi:hypothetical protein